MHLTPEQQADEQALRDKETGAELEVVNKVGAPAAVRLRVCRAASVVTVAEPQLDALGTLQQRTP